MRRARARGPLSAQIRLPMFLETVVLFGVAALAVAGGALLVARGGALRLTAPPHPSVDVQRHLLVRAVASGDWSDSYSRQHYHLALKLAPPPNTGDYPKILSKAECVYLNALRRRVLTYDPNSFWTYPARKLQLVTLAAYGPVYGYHPFATRLAEAAAARRSLDADFDWFLDVQIMGPLSVVTPTTGPVTNSTQHNGRNQHNTTTGRVAAFYGALPYPAVQRHAFEEYQSEEDALDLLRPSDNTTARAVWLTRMVESALAGAYSSASLAGRCANLSSGSQSAISSLDFFDNGYCAHVSNFDITNASLSLASHQLAAIARGMDTLANVAEKHGPPRIAEGVMWLRERARFAHQNVTFSWADLTTLRVGSPFDYINSVGVLHHTRDPLASLQHIVTHLLAPGGNLTLGLYHHWGRVLGGGPQFRASIGLDNWDETLTADAPPLPRDVYKLCRWAVGPADDPAPPTGLSAWAAEQVALAGAEHRTRVASGDRAAAEVEKGSRVRLCQASLAGLESAFLPQSILKAIASILPPVDFQDFFLHPSEHRYSLPELSTALVARVPGLHWRRAQVVSQRNEMFGHSALKGIRTFSDAWNSVLDRTGAHSYSAFRRALLRIYPQYSLLRRWHRETNALLATHSDRVDFREWACPAAAIDTALGLGGEGLPPDDIARAGARAVDAWVLGVHKMLDTCALNGVVIQWPDEILLYKENLV